MVTIGVRVVNAEAMRQLEAKARRRIERKVQRALTASVNEWRKLVISSTWFRKEPASTDSIIAKWARQWGSGGKATWALTYGWFNYKGSAGRAQWRLSLREWMYTPKVIERINKVFQGVGGG